MTNAMLRSAAILTIALSGTAASAEQCVGTPAGGAVRLVTEATNLRNSNGEVAFTVYPDDKSRFLAAHAKLARARVKTTAPVTTACFWLPPGHYAVAEYHDENDDHDFNHTLWIPKEGFGFSNDAPTSVGMPSFAAARFALPANGATIRMRTRYRR